METLKTLYWQSATTVSVKSAWYSQKSLGFRRL